MRTALIALIALAAPALAQTSSDPAPAGTYNLDPGHTSVLFRVSHLGFSSYTARFLGADAELTFDPAAPETMQVTVTIDAATVETSYPDPAIDFNAVIEGKDLLDAAQFPKITFTSTAVKLTGDNSADVTGDLKLHGVTKPVTLAVTFNGGYAGHPMDAGARIGFSATGSLNRSDFGMAYGIPAPGTTMGVGDRVDIVIETEFIDPEAPKVTK